ncbi:MAG: hypothetical protein FWE90_05045 [Defluviitaleaceae bacterium]|nr:hypothetical protein [Defluviitaleaceae bacterium]
MIIKTNMAALSAHRNMQSVGLEKSRASRRIAGGFRINSAADDAAGLAVSSKMKAQIRGLDQAVRNTQDAVSLVQTADGALEVANSMLIRMRELTIQALNDTNTNDDKIKIQQEVDQLLDSIELLANSVNFNTRNLLDGRLSLTMNRVAGAIRDFDETRLYKVVHQYGASFDCVGITATQFGGAIVYPPVRLPDEYGMRHMFPVHSETDSIVFSRVGDGVFNAVYMNGNTEYRATFHRGDEFIHLLHEPSGNMFTLVADSIITESLDAADGSRRIIVPVQTGAFEPAQLVINRHPTAFEREIPLQSPQSLGFMNMPDKIPTTAGLNASGVYKLDRTNIVVPDLEDIGLDPATTPITLSNFSALRINSVNNAFYHDRISTVDPDGVGIRNANAVGFNPEQNIRVVAVRNVVTNELEFIIEGDSPGSGISINGVTGGQSSGDFTTTRNGSLVSFTHTNGAVLSVDIGRLDTYLTFAGDGTSFNINIDDKGVATATNWVQGSGTFVVGDTNASVSNIDRGQSLRFTASNTAGILSFALLGDDTNGEVLINGVPYDASDFTYTWNSVTETVVFTDGNGHTISFDLGGLAGVLAADGSNIGFSLDIESGVNRDTDRTGVTVSGIDFNQSIDISIVIYDINGDPIPVFSIKNPTININGVPVGSDEFDYAFDDVNNVVILTHRYSPAYIRFNVADFDVYLPGTPSDTPYEFTFNISDTASSEITVTPSDYGIGNATAVKVDFPQKLHVTVTSTGAGYTHTLRGPGPGGEININGVPVLPDEFIYSYQSGIFLFSHPGGAAVTVNPGLISSFIFRAGDSISFYIDVDDDGVASVGDWVSSSLHRPSGNAVHRVVLNSAILPPDLRLPENGTADILFTRLNQTDIQAELTFGGAAISVPPVILTAPLLPNNYITFNVGGQDIQLHFSMLNNLSTIMFEGDTYNLMLHQQRGTFTPRSDIPVTVQRVNDQLHFSTQMIVDVTDPISGITTATPTPVPLSGRLVTSFPPGNNRIIFSYGGRDQFDLHVGYEDFSTLGNYIQFHCGEGGTVNPTSAVNGDRYQFTFSIDADGFSAGINPGSMTHNLHRVMATDDLTADGFLPTGVRVTNIQMDPLYRVVFGPGDAPEMVFENDGGVIIGTLTINGILPPHDVFKASNITGNVITFKNDRNHQITVTLADFASFRDDKLRHEGSEFTTTLPRTPGIHQIDPNQHNLHMTVERLPDGRFEYTVEMRVNGYMRTLKGTAQPDAEVVNFFYHGSEDGAMPINRSRLPVPPMFLFSMNVKSDAYGFNENPLERYLRRPGDVYAFNIHVGANRNATIGSALADPHTRATPTFDAGQGPLSGIRFELDNRVWFFNEPLNMPAPVLSVVRVEDSYMFTLELEDKVYTSQAFYAFPPVSPESPAVILKTGDTDSDAQRDGIITMHDINWNEVAFHLAFQGDALQTRLTQTARQLLPRIEVNGEIEGTRLVDSTLYGNGAHEGMRALGLSNTIVHSGHFVSGVESPLNIRFDKVNMNTYNINADVNGFSVNQSFTPGADEEIRLDFGEGRVITIPLGDLEKFDFANAAIRNLRYVESLGVFCFEDAVVERNGQPLWIHVGPNANQGIRLDIGSLSIHHLGGDTVLAAINVTTHKGGNNALTAIDSALSEVSGIRANLGAFQNRLEFTAQSTGITRDNLTSALSRIMDADIANEMALFTQAEVIGQAAMMMLAKANQQPDAVLQLLR